jgi:hypothetical protein
VGVNGGAGASNTFVLGKRSSHFLLHLPSYGLLTLCAVPVANCHCSCSRLQPAGAHTTARSPAAQLW